MSKNLLLSKRVPMVALKPSTSTQIGGNIFVVKDSLFLPNTTNVAELIQYLNSFEMGTVTGNETVDPKYPVECPPQRMVHVQMFKVMQVCREVDCNILGGLFLVYLQSFGVEFQPTHLRARVESGDSQFFEVVYPIFEGYFESPRTVNPDLIPYLDGVVCNNTGEYKLLHVTNHVGNEIPLMRQVAYLKRVFRYATSNIVPYPEGVVKDNLVHSPENQKELYAHSELFLERLID